MNNPRQLSKKEIIKIGINRWVSLKMKRESQQKRIKKLIEN